MRYQVTDYLENGDSSLCSGSVDVAVSHRETMVNWCYRVADHCDVDGGIVSVVVNYVDRFTMTRPTEVLHDRIDYKLLFVGAFYTACKIHAEMAIDSVTMAKMCDFSAQDIEAMEVQLIQALDWKLNPPTPLAFVHELLDLLPITDRLRETMVDIAQARIECTVEDYSFVCIKPSTIAYLSIVHALESLQVASIDAMIHTIEVALEIRPEVQKEDASGAEAPSLLLSELSLEEDDATPGHVSRTELIGRVIHM